jgi:hypothetical protein
MMLHAASFCLYKCRAPTSYFGIIYLCLVDLKVDWIGSKASSSSEISSLWQAISKIFDTSKESPPILEAFGRYHLPEKPAG